MFGCSTAKTSDTARSSTEQLLVSNAVDQALDKVEFQTFNGYSIFLNDAYVDCVDKPYVISSVRHRLLANGARLVDAQDKADVVVELRAGVVGTTSSTSFVGVPELALPGVVTLPEVRVWEKKSQTGTAKLGIVAYNAQTGEALGTGGMSLAKSDDSNWFLAGLGPFQEGSVRREVSRSTSGNAAIVRNRLPNSVVFATPTNTGLQFAKEPTKPTVERVSLEQTAEE